jgi:hypothetical protein
MTMTTSASTTATSGTFGKLECTERDGQFEIFVHGEDNCNHHAETLNDLFMRGDCRTKWPAYEIGCNLIQATDADYSITDAIGSPAQCKETVRSLVEASWEVTQFPDANENFPGERFDVIEPCTRGGIMLLATKTADECNRFTAALNDLITRQASGRFQGCEITSPSTTETSTGTSSASSTGTSSASSTATTTVTTTTQLRLAHPNQCTTTRFRQLTKGPPNSKLDSQIVFFDVATTTVKIDLGLADMDNLKLQRGLADSKANTFVSLAKGAVLDTFGLLVEEISLTEVPSKVRATSPVSG